MVFVALNLKLARVWAYPILMFHSASPFQWLPYGCVDIIFRTGEPIFGIFGLPVRIVCVVWFSLVEIAYYSCSSHRSVIERFLPLDALSNSTIGPLMVVANPVIFSELILVPVISSTIWMRTGMVIVQLFLWMVLVSMMVLVCVCVSSVSW